MVKQISTTTARSRPTTSAETIAIPKAHTRSVTAYGRTISITSRASIISLANDQRVPKDLQQEVKEWGLCKDEYQDTGHWPHQLYVRESRRMTGDFVVSQKDLQTDLTKPDVIGMGSYNSDSHNIRRFVNTRGMAENEGDMQVAVKPYQIPFRVCCQSGRRSRTSSILSRFPLPTLHIALFAWSPST